MQKDFRKQLIRIFNKLKKSWLWVLSFLKLGFLIIIPSLYILACIFSLLTLLFTDWKTCGEVDFFMSFDVCFPAGMMIFLFASLPAYLIGGFSMVPLWLAYALIFITSFFGYLAIGLAIDLVIAGIKKVVKFISRIDIIDRF